ncbi:chromatin modification- protein VID21 [Ascosphaera atra]|nr:chromatin modification- protein VID21 [Ascosphaera atra]
MLRDDLLRSKKDDLAQVITSRKRKLSELYYATAGATGGLEHEQEHEIDQPHAYKQREADFLDANDITKRRMFSEDTLPELPEITFPPSPSPPPAKRHEAEPGPERGPDTTKLQQEAIQEAEVETEAARPQEELSAPPATTAIPRAPSLATAQPQTAIATSTAPTTRPSLAPLQLVPSATAGLASSPISEPTPKTLDQGLQSPSSSVTSATTHAPTAASPRKSSGVAVEGLQTEGKPPPSLTLKEEREKAEQKELSQVEPHKVQEPPTPAKDSQKEEDEAAERQLQEQAAALTF